MTTARQSEIIGLIHKEVKPALGCTEPIAVALAVAKAMEIIEDKCSVSDPSWRFGSDYRILVEVSGNILKNGMGVGIPGTGMVGLPIAAALGAICGKSSYGLEVLKDLNEVSIERAKELSSQKLVKISQTARIDGMAAFLDAMTVRQKWWAEIGAQLQNSKR